MVDSSGGPADRQAREDGPVRSLAIDTVAAILATGAGTVVGGPVGGFVGAALSPGLSLGLREVVDRLVLLRRRRGGEVYSRAATISGLGEEGLAASIGSDERLAELAGRVFLVAQDAALPEKRRALAAVLAQAARREGSRPEVIDRALLLAAALAMVDPWHIRVLAVLEPMPGLPNEAIDEAQVYGLNQQEVEDADTGLQGVARLLMGQLLASGLIEDASAGRYFQARYTVYALTDLGRQLLALLRLPEADADHGPA